MWQYLANAVLSTSHTTTDTQVSDPPSSSSTSATSSFSWSRVSSYICEKATDAAFELAPIEDDLAFLRISTVLAHLSVLVYDARASDIGQTSYVELPLLGNLGNRRSVGCTLLHFR